MNLSFVFLGFRGSCPGASFSFEDLGCLLSLSSRHLTFGNFSFGICEFFDHSKLLSSFNKTTVIHWLQIRLNFLCKKLYLSYFFPMESCKTEDNSLYEIIKYWLKNSCILRHLNSFFFIVIIFLCVTANVSWRKSNLWKYLQMFDVRNLSLNINFDY